MSKPDESLDKIADWLRDFPPEKQAQLLKQIQLKAVTESTDEDLLAVPISRLGDYLAIELPTPPEIVKPGMVVRGEIHSLSSRAGKGKTTFTLNRFVRWAADLPMFDDMPELMAPGVPGGVCTLIIENEGSAGYFQDRMKDIIRHGKYTKEQTEMIHNNILVWGDGSYSGVKVDDTSKLDELKRGLKQFQPDIVFLDPFRSIWTGDENDGMQMNDAMDALMQLCHDYECAVFMNHHEGKTKDVDDDMSRSRGSTVLEGATATMERWQHVKGGTLSEISWPKMRYAPKTGKPAPVRVQFNFDSWTYDHVGEKAIDRAILQALGSAPDQYVGVTALAEELEESERKIRERVNALVEEGRAQKIREQGGGYRYRINTSDPDTPPAASGGLEVG